MSLNPYQKIIIDGEEIQAGDMNTPLKFEQLTQGIDLQGKRILDVGCNLGMMCKLASDSWAITKGIDINLDYINQARSLFPELDFECAEADKIAGDYDIIIASAMLHYVKDLDAVLERFSRCSKQVLCDIWLNDEAAPVFTLSHRNIFIPSKSAFLHIAGKYFKTIVEKGEALSPDISKRYVFHLSEPIPSIPQAVLIYGDANTGKTTTAQTYFDYVYLGTDHIARNWWHEHIGLLDSVSWFASIIRGEGRQEYIDFYLNWFENWLPLVKNRNIVLEGYDLKYDDIRGPLKELLNAWQITEINLTVEFDTKDIRTGK